LALSPALSAFWTVARVAAAMTALLKVYGVALSQPARSVLWALAIHEVSWLETCIKDWCVSESVQNARCSNDIFT